MCTMQFNNKQAFNFTWHDIIIMLNQSKNGHSAFDDDDDDI